MSEEAEKERPRLSNIHDGSERCGKFIAKDGGRNLYCDLPKGHPDTLPFSAPISGVQSAS
jgi:hypothetical protein